MFKETDNLKREFEFYLNSSLDMIGNDIGINLISDPKGASALQAWIAFDTYGKTIPCFEAEKLHKVFRAKKSVNLQIKLWAEDLSQGFLLSQSELIDYTFGWPKWVLDAVFRQAAKMAKEKIEFVPRFLKLVTFKGSFWLPEMDKFDAVI